MRRGQGVGEIRYGGSGFGTLGTGYVLESGCGTVCFFYGLSYPHPDPLFTSTDPDSESLKVLVWI